MDCGPAPGKTLTATGATVSNQGVLQARNGGTLKINNLTGELGNFILHGGELDLSGTYTLPQPINVGLGSALTLRGSWMNNGGITVDGGRLNLANLPPALGTITPVNHPSLGIYGSMTVAQLQTIPYTAFSNLYFTSGTVSGGTLEGAGIEKLIVTPPPVLNSTTLDGITLNLNTLVQPGAALSFRNGVNITKTVSLQSNSSSVIARMLAASLNATLGGTGEIVFDGAGPGAIDAQTVTATIGPNLTVRTGTGSGKLGPTGQFLNQGTILAQTAGESISIAATMTNSGKLTAINGSSIAITNTLGV